MNVARQNRIINCRIIVLFYGDMHHAFTFILNVNLVRIRRGKK